LFVAGWIREFVTIKGFQPFFDKYSTLQLAGGTALYFKIFVVRASCPSECSLGRWNML
jgi:hypothetical protein